MSEYNFKDLRVWQRSMVLAEDTYKVLGELPNTERFALADQIRRCAVSIPSNIAEGQKRLSNKETIAFTSIALGSLAELQTQLILCSRIYSIKTEMLVDECEQITKMLAMLVKSLKAKI